MENQTQYDKKLESVRHGYIVSGATVGLIVAGLAPATLFGYSLYRALIGDGWEWWAAGVAGGALAVTMEVIGGVSAHVVQTSTDKTRRIVGGAILAVYTIIGLVYMGFFEPDAVVRRTGFMAYLVAPMLYFAVAMLNATARETKTQEQAKEQKGELEKMTLEFELKEKEAQAKFEREQLAADKEAERRRLAKQAEIDARVKIETTKEAAVLKMEQERTKQAKIAAISDEKGGELTASTITDWRRVDADTKLELASLTTGEIAKRYPLLSKRAVREWKQRADDLAAKMGEKSPVKVALNGHQK